MKLANEINDLFEGNRGDMEILTTVIKDLMKDKKFDYDKKFSEFSKEALERARPKGVNKRIGMDVMHILDKLTKGK